MKKKPKMVLRPEMKAVEKSDGEEVKFFYKGQVIYYVDTGTDTPEY